MLYKFVLLLMIFFVFITSSCTSHSSTPSLVQKHAFYRGKASILKEKDSSKIYQHDLSVEVAARPGKSKFLREPEQFYYYIESFIDFAANSIWYFPYATLRLNFSLGNPFGYSLSIGYWEWLQIHFWHVPLPGNIISLGTSLNPYDNFVMGYGYGNVAVYETAEEESLSMETRYSDINNWKGHEVRRENRHFFELGYLFFDQALLSLKYEFSPDYNYEGYAVFFSVSLY